jgi:phage head maturation protease
MTDYETMAREREHEDAQRGYSIAGWGGPITAIDHRAVTTHLTRRSDNPQVFEGFACVYGKPNMYKGGIEVFVRGCFNHTLSTKSAVRFLIDHDASVCLGDSDSNLELVESDVGLAFKIRLQPGDIERLNGREQRTPTMETALF